MDADDLLSWLNVIRVCSARARHFDQRLDVLDLKPTAYGSASPQPDHALKGPAR
jgi:hypothetical protein